jgi:hypothetical protein
VASVLFIEWAKNGQTISKYKAKPPDLIKRRGIYAYSGGDEEI